MYNVILHEPAARSGRPDAMASTQADVQAHVQASAQVDVLRRIHVPEVNLAVWQRRLAGKLACEAVKLVVAASGDVRLQGPADALAGMLAREMHAKGWPDVPGLCADVAQLAEIFSAIMTSPMLSVRLDIVTGDACRKFHADYVTARLICSYTGPGSEWLGDEAAKMVAAGRPVQRRHVRQLAAGDVALFKGRLWSDMPIIHRSPPIAGTGQRRLVLVINPASEA